VAAAFALADHLVSGASPARAQQIDPLRVHFHPKGKAPSKFTLETLAKAKANLPFADTRDLEEQKKGFIAPMKDLKIMADAGHVAWDMERFQFLDQQDEFDSIHASLLRQSKLNNNYGLNFLGIRMDSRKAEGMAHPEPERSRALTSPGKMPRWRTLPSS
jgi:hypothetical protein